MVLKKARKTAASELRKRAEGRYDATVVTRPSRKADGDTRKLVHELQVHQIELEMQKEELRQSKSEVEAVLARYTDLYDFAPVGYVTLDRNGCIRQLNLTGAKLLGGERSRLLNRRFDSYIIDANKDGFTRFLREVFESRVQECFEGQFVLNGKKHIWFHIEALANEEKEECRTILFDLTDKIVAEAALQNAQKIESLGVLAGGIAHDFNNLLCGLFGFMEMANEALGDKDQDLARENLARAFSVFDRAKSLTRQLLTFSKGGAPVRKTMQIATLVRNSGKFALSGSNVSGVFDIAEDLWLCDCDENQMGQAIDNVIINGKQAMPMGGKIILTAQNISIEKSRSCRAASRTGNFVRISIKDHGIGMPKDILSRIFDPFFSTKDTGHGLGLATSFSIIQRHEGWIEVESEPGKGSTFHLFIPASQKIPSVSGGANNAKHEGNGTILVMDDEDFMLEIIGRMLGTMGYTMECAREGNEAVRLFNLAEQSGKSHVAGILDLTIPGGMGGKETVVALRKIRPDAILVAASGYAEDPVMAKPTDHGFTDRIIKPFKKAELSELLNRVFAGKK